MRSSPSLRALALTLPALLGAGCTASQPAVREPSAQARRAQSGGPRWGLAIHGGAGTLSREQLTPEREAALRAALGEALRAGHAILASGGSSLEAATTAVRVLEDSPYFNAGKGAVFTHAGKNELDAAIMDGATRRAGAVAGLRHVKNPILLARAVMERSPHVMLVGEGAEAFAAQVGVELVPESYFFTEERWQALQRALEKEKAQPGPSTAVPVAGEGKFGTVGAVALDKEGRLAAATSTGGMTNKRWGRVGDSPVIGAGTYASPQCAVSATGHGEFFIRYAVAHDICARLEYAGQPLEEAARTVVEQVLVQAGGEGGVIAMDAQGHVAMPFNSQGMYRGYMGPEGQATVAMFREPGSP
jgi:L-asparaginase / beta-aspartyl-peptidase